jgi:hypothetical protein
MTLGLLSPKQARGIPPNMSRYTTPVTVRSSKQKGCNTLCMDTAQNTFNFGVSLISSITSRGLFLPQIPWLRQLTFIYKWNMASLLSLEIQWTGNCLNDVTTWARKLFLSTKQCICNIPCECRSHKGESHPAPHTLNLMQNTQIWSTGPHNLLGIIHKLNQDRPLTSIGTNHLTTVVCNHSICRSQLRLPISKYAVISTQYILLHIFSGNHFFLSDLSFLYTSWQAMFCN